uniref:Uncharacterized protein n=1 Tax=Avena sativa TaxID=4498 RepID=A0ACD5TNI4_AVESA
MGNSGSASPARLGKDHVPHLEWKIHVFSALLETGAKSAKSSYFQCSGYKWLLQVTPSMKKKAGVETPYVGLCLKLCWTCLDPGHTVNAVFELSVYNHSKKMYCGYKASHNFAMDNTLSKEECLIPLQKLLKSSAFLVDDSCVFGVKILKTRVTSPQKKDVVVKEKATTVQNLFVQKKEFIKGTYTWTMDNYLELGSKNFVRSPTFEVGGHKWYLGICPRGDRHIIDCISLSLLPVDSKELSAMLGKVVKLTLSIMNQKRGKHFTITTGLVIHGSGWGWPWFLSLRKFKEPSGGYLVGSSCFVKVDFTIVGSSNDG